MGEMPIDTAPKDGTEILVFARWDWDEMYGEECGEEYAWRVAAWNDRFGTPGFWSVSNNPYSDRAVAPRVWHHLPE